MITSTINHKIRTKLNLTIDEYVCLDYLSQNKLARLSDFKRDLGLDSDFLFSISQSLKAKKMVVRKDDKLEISELWTNEFKANDSDFKVLWKIHAKGNLQTAKERFAKVMLKNNLDDIKEKLINYLKACSESDTFPKNLDTWLNPKKEHWNNPLPVRLAEKNKPVQKKVKYKII